MMRQELEAHLEGLGYTRDRFGHYHKDKTTLEGEVRRYRYKFGARSVRYEARGTLSGQWARLQSAFYSAVSLKDGALTGFSR